MASFETPFMDCFNITDKDYWYGGYETYNQLWPINNDSRPLSPFLPADYLFPKPSDTLFGPILHPVWMSSNGVVIFVDRDTPLHVSINDHSTARQVCLQSAPHSLRCLPQASSLTTLHYTVCGFENITNAAKFFLNEFGSVAHTDGQYPSLDVFLHPIWSTWARFKTNISDQVVINFAANIKNFGFNVSQLELDDKYSSTYGDLDFSETKFPNYTAFQKNISGIPLTAWVHPFINTEAGVFQYAVNHNHLLPSQSHVQGNSVSLVQWWNGYGSVINLLDSNTSAWYQERLSAFVEKYKLFSLKFDAGEETYLPKCVYSNNLTDPVQYTTKYNEFVGQQKYSSRSEMRTAYFGQRQPIFFRMLDRNSTWGLDNGLHSVLTTALSLGIAGYPFILPGMIGGNAYNSLVSEELYIRWMQLSVFLPVMQFSIPPWYFNNSEIISHALNMTRLHAMVVKDYMLPLIEEAAKTGFPIIRPLWWIDSENHSSKSFIVNDEFLIGEKLLVAPILNPAVKERAVYFPPGCWQCLSSACASHEPYTGTASQATQVLRVPKPFDILYFKRNKPCNCNTDCV